MPIQLRGGRRLLVVWLVSLAVDHSAHAEDPLLWSREISSGANGVTDVAFSPDGELIAVSAWDATVRLCRAEDGRVLHTLRVCEQVAPGRTTAPVFAVDFSPCGQFLAVGVAKGNGNAAQVWRVADQKMVHAFRDTTYVSSVAFSPDGQLLAIAHHRLILLFEPKAGRLVRTLSGHAHNVSDTAFSPDGRWLASVGFDRTLRLWSVVEGELLATLSEHGEPLDAVAFSPDGSLIAAAGRDNAIRLWPILPPEEGRGIEVTPARVLTGHEAPVNSLAFSPDGRLLVSGSGTRDRKADRENGVRLWSVADGKPLRVMRRIHTGPVTAVAFSPQGGSFVSGGLDHRLVHWSLTAEELP